MYTWWVSDTHFNHHNVIAYCGRPFHDVTEMNEALISRWNSVVGKGDTVVHLGDAFFGPQETWRPIMDRLNGVVTLVKGNHDRSTGTMLKYFSRVLTEEVLVIGGVKVYLSHTPRHPIPEGCEYNIHGHTHELYKRAGKHLCMSVEQWDYTPVHKSVVCAELGLAL